MASKMEEIKQEALQLSPHERADLAKSLILSLDEEEESNFDELWLAEIRRRSNAYKKDKSIGIPADEVFHKLRSESE
jgi:putative addiction module component (TIGR02574 family)